MKRVRRLLRRSARGFGAAAVAGLLLAACSRGDRWTRPVTASSAAAYEVWLSHVAETFAREDRHHIDEALQELKLKVMTDREVKRAAGERVETRPVNDELRAAIDGKTVGAVVQIGYELRLRRLTATLAALENAMRQNDRLVTKPGDLESRHHLDELRARQQERVAKYRDEIVTVKRVLAPLIKATGKELLPVEKPDAPPAPAAAESVDAPPVRIEMPAPKKRS